MHPLRGEGAFKFQGLPAAVAKSECYDRPAVSIAIVGNTTPAVAPPIAPGAAIAAIKASIGKASMAKASTEKPSMAKASMDKPSVAKASMAKASMENPSMAKASVAKASVAKASSAPDDLDELRRLPYIGHNQARLHGSR
jgi:hypothetical protein